MLQTPGSLKNRDVSLTAFSPRGLGAFGEIIDESPGMQWENEHHTQRLTATQSLAYSVCVRQCVWQNNRLEESLFMFIYVYVCAWMCPRAPMCSVCLLKKEEENRVIIPCFV